ncbi:MAG: hypothetical protein NPIRA06_20660 [Nitrospirales bacterium]|nr:MAG: hypothetical protein NPIRA06_20660 [Nitrospirales bacterium]
MGQIQIRILKGDGERNEHLAKVAQTMSINTPVWMDLALIMDLFLDLQMEWRRVRILIQKLGQMPIWEMARIAANFMGIRQSPGFPRMALHKEE